MEVKKIVEGMTAVEVAEVIDSNFKTQNKILEEDIAKQNNVIGVSEYKDFSEAEAVNVGDVRKYEGFLYECVEATTGAFDTNKWKKSSFKAETEKKLSDLGSRLGAPYRVTSFNFVNYPARNDGSSKTSGYFRGYQIDLSEFRDRYYAVYFRGSNFSLESDIVQGIIIDDDGNVESMTINSYPNSNSWNELPLTQKSKTLWATYCTVENGGEIWEPEYVEFLKESEFYNKEEIDVKVGELDVKVGEISIKLNGFNLKEENIILIQYPARNDGSSKTSGYFRGYQIDLSEFRDRYYAVYFRGSNFSLESDIVQGIIIDDDGNVESMTINSYPNSNSWNELPLTQKSKTLWATYCTVENGGEIWEPEYVEFLKESEFYNKEEIDYKLSLLGGEIWRSINIYLPQDIYIVSGKVSQLFYRGFVNAVNPYNYDIKIMCAVGKTLPRYYEVGSTVAVGDYPFKIEVRDDNRMVLAVKESTLHVIAETPNSWPLNVLCVGASATATGHWAAELKRLVADNYNANFVGRKLGTQDSSVSLEATGGWTWSSFINYGSKAIRFYISSSVGDVGYGDKLTHDGNTYTVLEVNLTEGVGNIRCAGETDITEPVNPSNDSGALSSTQGTTLNFSRWEVEKYAPFYNEDTDKIDFKTYADKYCNGSIDVIVTHLGVNSVLWEGSNINNVVNSAKKFIDGYFADFPNGKIIVSAIPMPDDGTNVYANAYKDNNVNRYGTLSTFMLYNIALRELTESYSNVYWAPSDIFFDTDYGYPKTEKNVNARISTYKELIGANGVHPVKEGSYMVADGIHPIFVKMIKGHSK